jgi:hypothetical protein
MLKITPNRNYGLAIALIAGLILFVGCGDSPEKQQMTQFIEKFANEVSEYAKAEDGQKAELAAKIESDMAKWTELKVEMGSELTPQVLDKLDLEYQKYAKEFKTLAGKS